MKTRTIYEAFDGETFDNPEACKAYEAERIETRIVGLSIEQVRAALSRNDTELADIIEELGIRINKARRAAGDFRRGGKSVSEDAMLKSPERLVEDQGKEAARQGRSDEPPAELTEAMRKVWSFGYDYGKLEKAA